MTDLDYACALFFYSHVSLTCTKDVHFFLPGQGVGSVLQGVVEGVVIVVVVVVGGGFVTTKSNIA